ncbi:hypothetical protein GOP47_0003434, partial [Adiantum capillus-veneris]
TSKCYNSVNFPHLETKVSRLSSKDVKKQNSLRYPMVSGFPAMMEMLHVLRSLWETLFPFALLWWNVMLCATCARYYSWNRSCLRLQWGGHQFHEEGMGKSGVEENGKKGVPLSYQSEDVSHGEMESSSLTQTSCMQKMELGSCLPQSLPSTQELNSDVSFHDARVDDVVLCSQKEHHDDHNEDFELEDSIMCGAHVSKALDLILPPGTSKLSCLHFPDESTQQPRLLEEAYWAACRFLLPHQVAPLVMYRINRNFLDMEAPILQLLHNIYTGFSTLEEHMQVNAINFVARVLSRIHSKEYAYLARKIANYLTSTRCSVHDSVIRLVSSSSLNDHDCTKNILSSDPLEGTMDYFASGFGEHPPSSHISDCGLRSDVCDMLDDADQDVSDDECSFRSTLSQSYDGCVRSSHVGSNDCLNDGNAVQSRQMDGDIVYPADSQSTVESGKEMGFFHDGSIQLNENYCFFYDRSADWDVKYGGSHLCQGVDSICGGYYDTGDQVLSNYSYFDGRFECDDTVSGGLKFYDGTEAHGSSSKLKEPPLSDTWWDEDAVLVGNQAREEVDDSMEQAWQVV